MAFCVPNSREVYLSGYCDLGVKTKHLELIKKTLSVMKIN